MKTYFITIFLVIFFAYLAQRFDYKTVIVGKNNLIKHTNVTGLFYVFAAAVLVFVAGFRYYVGADYGNYYVAYKDFADDFFDSLLRLDEPGFKFICWLVVLCGGNGSTVIFVSALITIFLFLRTIYKNTDMLFFAILLYVFLGCWHGSFNGIRQYIATAIIFSALRLIKEKKFWKYIVAVFIAFLFHSSAILMIFIYFIAYNKITLKNLIILIASSLIILYSFNDVLAFAGFVLNQEFIDSDYITRSVSVMRILVAFAPAVFFIFYFQNKNITQEQKFWINMLILNAIMMFATSNSTYLARMGIYTTPFLALGIPELIKSISEKDKKIVTTFILLAFAFYWFYDLSNANNLNNFRFIFGR